jgi:hypothetical protein
MNVPSGCGWRQVEDGARELRGVVADEVAVGQKVGLYNLVVTQTEPVSA